MVDQDAFDGVRVVELAQWVFVPVAGALLADWGADVIHIEPPEGDPYRALMTQGIGADKGGVNLSMVEPMTDDELSASMTAWHIKRRWLNWSEPVCSGLPSRGRLLTNCLGRCRIQY